MATRAEIESLIERCALRDRAAFSTLYEATSAKLFGVCLRILNNRAVAEETLQDVFVAVWTNADRYRSNGLSPMTWMITIARNRAIDRLRAKRAQAAPLEAAAEVADSAPGPETLAAASADRVRIVACFGELEADKADAVRRAYLEGETYKELAERYEVPLNTMRTWLRRSLMRLRECLAR